MSDLTPSSDPPNYLVYFLSALLVTKTLNLCIDWRQLKKYCETSIHPYLKSVVNTTEFNSSQQYNFEKHMFGMIHELVDTLIDLWFIYTFAYSKWWNWLDTVQFDYGLCQSIKLRQDMIHAVVFVVTLSLVSTVLGLPFKIYSTFVIEEKWGFNKTTRKTFICDLVKSFFIGLVFTVILIPLMLWIVDAAGDKLVISLVTFTFIVIVVINLLVPTVILPLFYKFTDLEDG